MDAVVISESVERRKYLLVGRFVQPGKSEGISFLNHHFHRHVREIRRLYLRNRGELQRLEDMVRVQSIEMSWSCSTCPSCALPCLALIDVISDKLS